MKTEWRQSKGFAIFKGAGLRGWLKNCHYPATLGTTWWDLAVIWFAPSPPLWNDEYGKKSTEFVGDACCNKMDDNEFTSATNLVSIGCIPSPLWNLLSAISPCGNRDDLFAYSTKRFRIGNGFSVKKNNGNQFYSFVELQFVSIFACNFFRRIVNRLNEGSYWFLVVFETKRSVRFFKSRQTSTFRALHGYTTNI